MRAARVGRGFFCGDLGLLQKEPRGGKSCLLRPTRPPPKFRAIFPLFPPRWFECCHRRRGEWGGKSEGKFSGRAGGRRQQPPFAAPAHSRNQKKRKKYSRRILVTHANFHLHPSVFRFLTSDLCPRLHKKSPKGKQPAIRPAASEREKMKTAH